MVININTLSLKDLSKKDVVNSDGNVIGRIEGAIVTNQGNVNFLSVKLEKDVVSGLRTKPNIRQDIEMRQIAGIMDRVVLNHPLNGFAKYFRQHKEKHDGERLMEFTDTKEDSIGTVEDLMIEQDSWKVPDIREKVNTNEKEALEMKSIKPGGDEIAISLKSIKNIGDMVMLKVTSDHLNDILEYPLLIGE